MAVKTEWERVQTSAKTADVIIVTIKKVPGNTYSRVE